MPAEPRLSAIARQLLGRGISGTELTKLEEAWLPLLESFPWSETQAEGLRHRGRTLFGIGAKLLGGDPEQANAAGELWSLVDGALHCSDDESREFLLAEAHKIELPRQVPRELRPLTVLAALAAKDLGRSGGLGRGAAAVRHRLTGRFPTAG